MNSRTNQLTTWVQSYFDPSAVSIMPLAGDASFRRYFRVQTEAGSAVLMDAPPEKEACDAFINIIDIFKTAPVRFPKIIAKNLSQGFLLLTDFGDRQLLSLLSQGSVDGWYTKAMDALSLMQSHYRIPVHPTLPHFDYWREFTIFHEWYLGENKKRSLSSQSFEKLKNLYQRLVENAKAQPQGFVHRDYHSRNLMVCEDNILGILDFQDAVIGPLTYDLVSLLRDCYIAWPLEKIRQWVKYYYDKVDVAVDFETFLRWFDWTGLQRHLKCLGIFSRLSYRD